MQLVIVITKNTVFFLTLITFLTSDVRRDVNVEAHVKTDEYMSFFLKYHLKLTIEYTQ